jgi:protocatechuate 3,4-dioxygenase beta subunit
VLYPGRTPHIHVKIKLKEREVLTTQFFVRGEARNERDGVFRGIRSAEARETVLADYVPIKDSKGRELAAKYDVILGLTPSA